MRACVMALTLTAVVACSGKAPAPGTPSGGIPVPPLADSAFPKTPLGAAALRGRAILIATRDSLPDFVGNELRCTSCHLDEGRRPYAMTWVGVHGRYPQYRSRSASIQSLEDRINDCFLRSLAGKALPPGDDRMRAIQAYMAFISAGVPVGSTTRGQGIDSVTGAPPDTLHGGKVFIASCSRCHGANGEGSDRATPAFGAQSFTIGAGMGRWKTAAGFIRRNMPFDQPGTLSVQDAIDVAAFIDSRPRPDFPGKERDWPKGGAPPDLPYRTGK
ncbi:MAG TPA: c-type cytochrome [Gemmatimonadaceae bacterium]|nr:c-type cytochrome [Gemmatimonadaceae bacterium]